jgi:uncharacterized protein (DUF488 family)
MVIHTIGYEGAPLGEFIDALRQAEITQLIDVREIPWSRRGEYTKKILSGALIDAGIQYLHLKSLGNPKESRDAAKSGDMDTYRRLFARHLETEAAQAGLAQVVEMTRAGMVCLMCLERQPERCHRSMVAARLAEEFALTVRHLMVRPGLFD